MTTSQENLSASVLLVEDSPSDALLVQFGLEKAQGCSFEVTVVGQLEAAFDALRRRKFDVALLDLGLPDSSGMATIRRLQTQFPQLPIVVMTGADDETEGAEAIRQGVQDYLTKGRDDARTIARAIRYAIERKRAEQSLKSAMERFKLLSDTAAGLLSTEEPQNIINELCRDVMKQLDCQLFLNFLADEATGRLHLNACAGVPEVEMCRIARLDYGVGISGSVARDRKRLIAEDIQNSADPKLAIVKPYGIHAYCCHPLMAEGKLIGTISFGTKTRIAFNRDEVETMRVVADEVAIALQRDQARNEARALNESLEQRVAERTAEARQLAAQLRALAVDLTQAEQLERRRLAQVLHDHIQQLLVACKIQVGITAKSAESHKQAQAMERINSLVQEAIEACRLLTVELSPPVLHQAGLGAGLEWLAHRFRRQSQFEVEVAVDASAEPKGEAARLLLFDCARELLLNALKHSGSRRAQVTLTSVPEGWTQLVVEDSGIGFDPASLSASAERGGFGLFSIQQRLRHLGGRVDIESAPGHGARISLLMPPPSRATPSTTPRTPAETAVESPTPDATESCAHTERIRVLLADDHKILRQGLASMLRLQEGIEVAGEAADGAEAVELAHQLHPDVVIMDVTMPRMNGVEATRRIAAELPRTRIIALSMHNEADMATAMREAGAVEYLTKGGPSESLIGAIRACSAARS